MSIVWLMAAIAAFALSYILIRLMLISGVGLARDIPNNRSMHQRVVLRGGGLAFVIATVCVFSLVRYLAFPESGWVWYILPVIMMTTLGALDDQRGLGILTRLVVQVAAAALVSLIVINGSDSEMSVNLSIRQLLFLPILVIGIVWVINLYNFMDGMDGLAASQGVIVLATMALWLGGQSDSYPLALFCLILAAATAAFLPFNWYPARVFMGDTGSLTLGVAIAAASAGSIFLYQLPTTAFLILMGVFLFDATATLGRRIFTRQTWWQSHRSHFYQRAEAIGISQRHIVGTVVIMDLILAILASLVVYDMLLAQYGVIIALAVLIAVSLLVRHFEDRAASTNRRSE
ncbi:MAG: hypothetical protein DHS20C01_15700 [marine bacterium B5-7]|nr:MAG: hypothetical protein DHS20C01_15700 [marine bacterium B5-7]